MTSPCQNCHSAPTHSCTAASNSDPLVKKDFPRFSDIVVDPNSQESPYCKAAWHWPSWLEKPQTELQGLPFWVRNNFEKTARQYHNSHAELAQQLGISDLPSHLLDDLVLDPPPASPALPLRIHVGRAQLEARLFPKSFPIWRGLYFLADPKAEIRAELSVMDNEIFLGSNPLIEVQGIKVGVPEFAPDSPYSSSTDSVWFEASLSTLGINQSGQIETDSDSWLIGTALNYFNERLAKFIPEEFLSNDKTTLPTAYNLEDLIFRGIRYFLNHPAKTEKKKSALQLHDLFKPGSSITLNIEDLSDLFRFDAVNLGPSQGKFTATLGDYPKIYLDADDFSINLEPMDYLAAEGRRGKVRLKAGTLSPGYFQFNQIDPQCVTEQFDTWMQYGLDKDPIHGSQQCGGIPGIHAGYDTATKQITLNASLRFSLELEVASVGPVSLEGDLVLGPKSAQFNLSGKADLPPPKGPTEFSWRGSLPLPVQENGLVDFPQLLKNLVLESVLDVRNGTKEKPITYHSDLSVYATGQDPIAYRLEIDKTERQTADGNQTILRDGVIDFKLREGVNSDKCQVIIQAGQFHEKFGRVNLLLSGIKAYAEVDRLHTPRGVLDLRIPAFVLSVNQGGSQEGILRGPVQIRQSDEKTPHVRWDGPQGQLTVEGLDLQVDAQQIRLLSLVPEKFRAFLNSRIRDMGLDGRLQGDLVAQFLTEPESWQAQGKLSFQGDNNGDAYLLNGRGNKIATLLCNSNITIRSYDSRTNIGDVEVDTWVYGMINSLFQEDGTPAGITWCDPNQFNRFPLRTHNFPFSLRAISEGGGRE
jgi:hypothetical protein